MKIAGDHQQPSAHRCLRNHRYWQSIVTTWEASAATATNLAGGVHDGLESVITLAGIRSHETGRWRWSTSAWILHTSREWASLERPGAGRDAPDGRFLQFCHQPLALLEDDQSQIRLLFYLLLKAEALRSSPAAIELRRRAQAIAERIGSQSFELFMNLEALTQSTSRVYGMQVGIIAEPGIRPTTLRGYEVQVLTSTFSVVEDDACLAVGVERMSLLSAK